MVPHPVVGLIVQAILLPPGLLAIVAVKLCAAVPASTLVEPEVVRPTTMGFTVICTVAVLVESVTEVAVAVATHGPVKVGEAAVIKVSTPPERLIVPQVEDGLRDQVTPALAASLVSVTESVVLVV